MIRYPESFDYTNESKLPCSISDIKKFVELIDNDVKIDGEWDQRDIFVDIALTGSAYISLTHCYNNDLDDITVKLRIADHDKGVNGYDIDFDWQTYARAFDPDEAANKIEVIVQNKLSQI